MDLKDAIYSRRAVRAYKQDPIDEATIKAIIDAAIQAPSAVNEQPWSFTVVRDKALLACVSDAAKAHMLATTPVGLLSHHFKDILSDPKFNIFYDAPVLIVIASKTEGPWATIDCALAAQNLMLAVRAAGLGTCWIGLSRPWLDLPAVKAKLGIPAEWQPVAPLVLGHPRHQPPATHRNRPKLIWAA